MLALPAKADELHDGAADWESGARRLTSTKGNVNVAWVNRGMSGLHSLDPRNDLQNKLTLLQEFQSESLSRNRAWRNVSRGGRRHPLQQ